MHVLRIPTRAAALAALVLLASGCKAYPPGVPLPDIIDEVNATLLPPVVLLRAGDTVSVRFQNNPGNNQTAVVRPDGRAAFYLLDEVEVEGMTVDELDEELTRRYEESLISPDLTVSLGRTAPRQVLVLGRNGRNALPLTPKMNMGLIEFFARTRIPRRVTVPMQHVVLMRWMPEEGRRRIWIIDAREEYWFHPTDLLLQADDIIYIPEQPLLSASEWMRTFMRLLPLPQFVLRQT